MTTIKITFSKDLATITITFANGSLDVRLVKSIQALLWMSRQGLPWQWNTLPDGLEQAVWNKGE